MRVFKERVAVTQEMEQGGAKGKSLTRGRSVPRKEKILLGKGNEAKGVSRRN